MEEALSRQEYPAMLERLPPAGAVSKLNERVRKIGKVNSDIADWLQERRKVEDAYVAALKKLVRKPLQDVGSDMGILDAPWKKIISSTESIAQSHATLSNNIDKDVEQPLRNFVGNNREMQAMTTIQGNLASMARELDSAQEKSDKLSKKGGKASTQKVEVAMSQLQSARQQWDSQAPFIFETLQALDESRLNHLRDVLTQYQTHEADQIERNRVTVEETLAVLLEVDTAQEIRGWSQSNALEKTVSTRRARGTSNAGSTLPAASTTLRPPPIPTHSDNMSQRSSEQSARQENSGESRLKSRFGTMLGRRRQSVHGGFAQVPSPTKVFSGFGRNLASREGRPHPSPRASSSNLRDSPSQDNRLSALAESPTKPSSPNGANGTDTAPGLISDALPTTPTPQHANGTNHFINSDSSSAQPPPGPPPSQLKPASEPLKDSEGFSVPSAMNDPISQAQQEAAQESDQTGFKLDIRNEPIQEQDADAQAALSNVANTLRYSQAATPTRKLGTVRGRRDVRNTIYAPQSLDVPMFDSQLPPSPGHMASRASTLPALPTSDHHAALSTSDTTSIRSGYSLTNNVIVKHADMFQPGLNASIIETVTATFANGVAQTAKVNGEVALVYNKSGLEETPPTHLTVRINNFPNLEAIGPNRTFIHPISDEKPDEYTINVSSITPKSSVAFTYKVHIDDGNLMSLGPLLLKPAWKPQGDKLALVVEYSLNSVYSSEPVLFHNLVIIATYAGARATGCQTKPTGTHLKEKSLVYWRLGDLALSHEWHKVICRFVGTPSAVPEPGHIEAKWEVQSAAEHLLPSRINLSRLEAGRGKENQETVDPFADDSVSPAVGNWVAVESSKKLVAGKYEAQ